MARKSEIPGVRIWKPPLTSRARPAMSGPMPAPRNPISAYTASVAPCSSGRELTTAPAVSAPESAAIATL